MYKIPLLAHSTIIGLILGVVHMLTVDYGGGGGGGGGVGR